MSDIVIIIILVFVIGFGLTREVPKMPKKNRIWVVMFEGKPYTVGKKYLPVVAFLTKECAHSLYGTKDAKESGYTIKKVEF
jgi:hypothetical protein